MTSFEISQLIIKKGIKSKLELFALAQEQKEAGKTDVAEFIINRGPKVIAEVLDTAWEIEKAQETLQRSKKT